MNKTALKVFFCFTLTAALVSLVLLCLNFFGFSMIITDNNTDLRGRSPQGTIQKIDAALIQTDSGFKLLDDSLVGDDCWCILVNDNGDIVWAQNKPDDIPAHYSINDIARLTRWFLNDYPVYVRTNDFGLLIYGTPKNSVGKYDRIYSMHWFNSLPQRLIGILLLNLVIALILASVFGLNLYRRMQKVLTGVNDLQLEKTVRLKERGIFKEISRSINQTSDAIERKNAALAQRESARSNWVSGISHDVRTPLSLIMGYSEELMDNKGLSDDERRKLKSINAQSVKIKKLIEDLSLISSLEYDMQPSQKKPVRICPLLRLTAAEAMNNTLGDKYSVEMNFEDEKATVIADSRLLERAIFNLLNNSVVHNPNGCKITISERCKNKAVCVRISDNGSGVTDEVTKNIKSIPKAAHGLGLPMAYKIIRAHGGEFNAFNSDGFCIEITLPCI